MSDEPSASATNQPPADASVDGIIGQVRAAIDKHDLGEARARVNEGLSLAPDNLMLLDLAGFVCFFLGDYASTERHCRGALAVKPDHAYACKGLGLALARQGQVDAGVASLERAVALAPDWADSYWDLAVVLMEAGRSDEALQAAERAEKAIPAEAKRLRVLAQTIRSRGHR